MKNNDDTVKISKLLSLVLRHSPQTIHLKMDKEGWVEIEELIRNLKVYKGIRINTETLFCIVKENDKQRFAVSPCGEKIRANQGHSVAVDLGLERRVPPAALYHGTAERFADIILSDGLKPMSRQFVHLSVDEETAVRVGKRHGKPVVLRIDAQKMHEDGHAFYLSDNNVWLVSFVPNGYISI